MKLSATVAAFLDGFALGGIFRDERPSASTSFFPATGGDYLLQCTLHPGVIESSSVKDPAQTIKSRRRQTETLEDSSANVIIHSTYTPLIPWTTPMIAPMLCPLTD